MFDLRAHTLALQRLEQSAVERVGMRARLVEDAAITGKGAEKYIGEFVGALLDDIGDEAKASARLGVELGEAIKKAKASRKA